ncbi:MAG: T9SS type A sorting domain-containing protein [Bacteroidota bacterium]
MLLRLLTLTFLLFLAQLNVYAQINLIGMSPRVVSIDVIEWQPMSGMTPSRYPAPLYGWANNTGLFDAYQGKYYLSAITPNGGQLMSFQPTSNQISFSGLGQISNSTEIDMSNGRFYSIVAQISGDLGVYEFNPSTGSDTLLGSIVEPGVQEVAANATAFDSNNGILYYIGQDSNMNYLYTLNLRGAGFSWSKISLPTVFNPISQTIVPYFCVNFDNQQNVLFAVTAEYDTTWTQVNWKILEINRSTGNLTTRYSLGAFPYLMHLGTSVYDQNSGTLLLTGPDTLSSGGQRLILFNTTTNTITIDLLPAATYEIACDNHQFAQNRYGSLTNASNLEKNQKMSIYPNPANNHFLIRADLPFVPVDVLIQALNGQSVLQTQTLPSESNPISLSTLAQGLYIVHLHQGESRSTPRLLVR